MDDDDLIAALAGGDDTALRELFVRHAPWLAARLRAGLPPPDVEDVLQETFLAVWKGAKAYKPQGAAQAWLWVIARNQAAFLLRKRGPATTGLPDETTSRLSAERADGGAFAPGGTDPAVAALARADLAAASSTLSAPEREVLRLIYVEDRPIAEVAKIIGIPEGTVKSRAYRARRLLRAALRGVPHDAGARAAEGGAMNDDIDAMNDIDLDRVWAGVAAEVWRRHPGRAERVAARLLRSPGLARALLTTPSLLLPWLVATVVIFGTGATIQVGSGEPLVWLLAPAVAAVGIAYAYGPGLDPAWELIASSAVSDRMILLARAVAVFAVNAAFGLMASALSASAAGLTFAWLIPMAAICALTLAVAVAVRNAVAGAAVGVVAWGAIVLVKTTGGGGYGGAVTDSALYLPYLAAAVCCAAVVFYATRTQKGTL